MPCTQAQSPVPGCLDTTFGTGGLVRQGILSINETFRNGEINDMAVAPDGSIYVMGSCNDNSISNWRVEVMKYTPSGAMATAYGWNGHAEIEEGNEARAVKMAPYGDKMVCAVMSATRQFVMRLNATGQRDAFGSSGTRTMTLYHPKSPIGALEVQPDGSILTFGLPVDNTAANGWVVVNRFWWTASKTTILPTTAPCG